MEESEFASFILGWCIAFLLQLRGFSAIHSSAIEMGEQAVLISGGSGAGKSTTALSLIHAGYRYLADDIAMVNPEADMLSAHPVHSQQEPAKFEQGVDCMCLFGLYGGYSGTAWSYSV